MATTTPEPADDALFPVLIDPGSLPRVPEIDYALARAQARQEVLEEVADWLERCVRRVQLARRVELAQDLRDGTWKQAEPLGGLRPREILLKRADMLRWRRVPTNQWPKEVFDAVRADAERRRAKEARDEATTAKILQQVHGMAAEQAKEAAAADTANRRW